MKIYRRVKSLKYFFFYKLNMRSPHFFALLYGTCTLVWILWNYKSNRCVRDNIRHFSPLPLSLSVSPSLSLTPFLLLSLAPALPRSLFLFSLFFNKNERTGEPDVFWRFDCPNTRCSNVAREHFVSHWAASFPSCSWFIMKLCRKHE